MGAGLSSAGHGHGRTKGGGSGEQDGGGSAVPKAAPALKTLSSTVQRRVTVPCGASNKRKKIQGASAPARGHRRKPEPGFFSPPPLRAAAGIL